MCGRVSALGRSQPEAIALSSGPQALTYAELDARAESFARYLLGHGIGSGAAVGICLGRSMDWVIAALGTMRAGAAYVPLDPTWPDSRVQFAVADSGAKALVAPRAALDRLKLPILGIDPARDARAIAESAEQGIDQGGALDSLAYLIYTSGSTGAPKGVEITHANLNHLIAWHTEAFQLTRDDRSSHLAGLGFDAAVWEIWPTLAAGATLCIPEEHVRSSPELIQQWMIDERITVGFVPTAHAQNLLALAWPATTSLRYLLTGGDVLHQAPPLGLPFTVVNNYGPTECTVVATSAVVAPGARGTPPIGRPITGASVYLLGENGQQVPDGEVGEIHIGGGGVGRGYRNLPELTAEVFVKDPFLKVPGARMYKSGDLGARRADGQIEFHGRKDRQVQIRGQRVELDEIGSALGRHKDVSFAAVTARTSAAGATELTAYVLPSPGSSLTSTELERYLLRTLPAYMVPTHYLQLESLPLTGSGKVDLGNLANLGTTPLAKSAASTAQPSAIEARLLAVVRQLLHDDEIGYDDNFFLAGGHSLLGMQLILHLSEGFDVEVSLQELFEAPTIRQLAVLVEAKLEAQLHGDTEQEGSAKPAARRTNHFFLVQHRSDYLARALSRERSVLPMNLTAEDLRRLGPEPTVEAAASLLIQGMLEQQPSGPYTLGGYCVGGVLALEIASQLREMGKEVGLLVLLDTPSPAYYGMPDVLSPSLRDPRFLLRRVARLGPRLTIEKIFDRLLERMPEQVIRRYTKPYLRSKLVVDTVHSTLTKAVARYQPKPYNGKVLLLLADDHAPKFDFYPGWKAMIGDGLEVEHLDAHHNDLAVFPLVDTVAAIIRDHLPERAPAACAVPR